MRDSGRARLSGLTLALLLLTSCGGGGGTSATAPIPTPDPPAPPVVPPPAPEPPPAPAPPAPPRDLAGTIATPQGLPIPAAVVQTPDGLSTISDELGKFEIAQAPGATTSVRVEREGYVPADTPLALTDAPLDVAVTLQPVPVWQLDPIALQITPGFTTALITIPLPGPNLPYEYFLYRRTASEPFDWSTPLNPEPLVQVAIDNEGQMTALTDDTSLRYTDNALDGGEEYYYTIRLREPGGDLGIAAPEVKIGAIGFGPATLITPVGQEEFYDLAPRNDGTLLALYRDHEYQPWHRFVIKEFDGQGGVTEQFRTEGVYDDARLFVDKYDATYFLYRRNGIEFLFETFLYNIWDNGAFSDDINLGQSNRRVLGELSGQLLFRDDPDGLSPMESVMIMVDRDLNVVAKRWKYGTHPPEVGDILGPAATTYQPKIDCLTNRAGDVIAFWNQDFSDLAYYQLAMIHGNDILPTRYLASGEHMAVRAGLSADDQFVIAFTTTPAANVLKLHRYRGDGTVTGDTAIDLTTLGASLQGGKGGIGIVPLPNGHTLLLTILNTATGRHLHGFDITDYEEILDLGPISLDGAPVPSTIRVETDRNGRVSVITTEGIETVYRRLFWPVAG